jgi:hypothetical protein
MSNIERLYASVIAFLEHEKTGAPEWKQFDSLVDGMADAVQCRDAPAESESEIVRAAAAVVADWDAEPNRINVLRVRKSMDILREKLKGQNNDSGDGKAQS